jgi:hypothetical protein
LWTLLNRLWDFTPAKHTTTRIMPTLERLRQRLSRMSIVFLISDFFFQENMFEEVVFKQLVSKNDLIPIILNDPLETELPEGQGFLRFRDLETGQQQCIRLSRKNRLIYSEHLRQQRRDLITQFYRYGLDFQEIKTDEPFYELLYSLFLMRKR